MLWVGPTDEFGGWYTFQTMSCSDSTSNMVFQSQLLTASGDWGPGEGRGRGERTGRADERPARDPSELVVGGHGGDAGGGRSGRAVTSR